MTVDGNSKSLPRGVNLSKVGDDTNNDQEEEKSKDTDETPKGKICCLLCRGFISYKNSDRTRFRDHMANEHDVKFDSDVILAVSVMSAREKQHIVAAAMSRLAEIGNNQLPSTAELLLPRPAAPQVQVLAPAAAVPAGIVPAATVPAPASRVPVQVASRAAAASPSPSSQGRGGGVSSSSAAARGRGSYRGTIIRPQIGAPQQLAAAAAAGGKAPFNIQNTSISISVVDQAAKCTQCPMTFKNSVLLAEHTKTVHLARFANPGLFFTAPGEKYAAGQKAASARAFIQSPGGCNKRARTKAAVRTSPPQWGRFRGFLGKEGRVGALSHQQQMVKYEPVAAAQQHQGSISSQHQQFLEQSAFKNHKMGHLKKNASDVPAPTSDSKEALSKNDGSMKGRVDCVDLGEVSNEKALEDGTSVPETSNSEAESNYNSTGASDLLLAQVVCEHCGKICKDDVALKHHFYIVHRNNVENLPKLFSCKLCPKRFCQLNKLNRHMITHNKLKRYICSACKKSFSRSDTLKNHVKVFHNEAILKMFTCNICPKTYHYKKDLNRHIKIVHSTK